ncbi:transporter [Formosa sp. 3Alg 14/1]|uniref:transporter n=1 Tax=Formosa sp. 3Alg 14/1 TaxID=3382190 RepID=UPI0039BE0ED0
MRFKTLKLVVFTIVLSSINKGFSQAETPTTFFMPPKDLMAVNLQYLNLESNLSPSQDVVLASGTINVDAFIVPFLYSFNLDGRIAQILVTPTYGSMTGTADISRLSEGLPEDIPNEFEFINKSGFMDSSVWLRVGLLNAPALDLADFSQYSAKFQMYALVGFTAPVGEYNQSRRVNLGANRWAFRLGLPMVLALNENKKASAHWEINPNLYLYTNNNNPFAGETKRQTPLFVLNQHVSKYFMPKLWGSVDLGYQYGGVSQIDDLPKGERINQLAGGVSLGYSVTSAIKIQSSYGRIWFNESNGHMFRFLATMTIPSKSDREMLAKMKQNK